MTTKIKVYFDGSAQQINGREAKTATFLLRSSVSCTLRVIGFCPRHLNRYAAFACELSLNWGKEKKMGNFILIVVNCLGIAASICSFILSLILILKGNSASAYSRKRLVYSFICISVLSASLFIFLSFRLKSDIETVEQSGSFNGYAIGEQEIFYVTPYQSPPNLVFVESDSFHSSTSSPSVLQQRADGFKVELYPNSSYVRWKATGIQKH